MSSRTIVHVVVARAVQLTVSHLVTALPVAWGEPLVLRWWRVADEHPLRTWIALVCLLAAARGRAPAAAPAEGGKCL